MVLILYKVMLVLFIIDCFGLIFIFGVFIFRILILDFIVFVIFLILFLIGKFLLFLIYLILKLLLRFNNLI